MWSTLMSMITRGKVNLSTVAQRTVLQVSGLDNEEFDGVELLLPPGYTARPLANADIMIFQCNGTRDHKVALGGDSAGQVQDDLAAGEFGMVGFGHRFIFRTDRIEVVDKAGSSFVLDGKGSIIATPAGGNFQVVGQISASAGMAVTGAITATGNVTAGFGGASVEVLGHRHSASGGSGTGGPPVAGS